MKTLIAIAFVASAFGIATAQDCGTACGDKANKVAKKEGACCQSTATKKVAKAGKGCCNEPGKVAKFKVFAGGKYYMFGCAGSAEKGRTDLMGLHLDVGSIQVVSSKNARIS
jgi:hypothetical protein